MLHINGKIDGGGTVLMTLQATLNGHFTAEEGKAWNKVYVNVQEDLSDYTLDETGYVLSSEGSYYTRYFDDVEGEVDEKQGPEFEYEYVQSDEMVITRPGYGRYKCYKTYITPAGDTIKTDVYILSEEVELPLISRNYLRFETKYGDCLLNIDSSKFNNLQYSFGYEASFAPFPHDTGLTIPDNSTVWLKADGVNGSGRFTTSNRIECHGNVMSLLGGQFEDNFDLTQSNVFQGLFANTMITTAPEIPATKGGYYSCERMFSRCEYLVEAPKLCFEEMAYATCAEMFENCTALTTADFEISLNKATYYSYSGTFIRCTALTTAPVIKSVSSSASLTFNRFLGGCSSLSYLKVLETNNFGGSMFSDWVDGVAATGTFVKSANATWADSFGTSAIPTGWTVVTE